MKLALHTWQQWRTWASKEHNKETLHENTFLYARKIYQYLQLIIKTTSTILQSIFKEVLVKSGLYTAISHYLHNILLILCLGQGSLLMSPNIDNYSGRPAHLVQVRQALEGSSPEALPHQELLGTSLLRLSSTSHGEGARKIQLQQTSSQQGRGPDTGRVGRAPALAEETFSVLNSKKELRNRDFIILYLSSIYCRISTNSAPINEEFCCWWCPSTTD